MTARALLLAWSIGQIACAAAPAHESAAAEDEELTLALGEEVYLDHCARCHGLAGRGDGPDGRELRPRPRDFVGERFEYKSTPGDEWPTDEELERTIVRGVLAEGMPAFGILTPHERHAVIQYLKSFAAS